MPFSSRKLCGLLVWTAAVVAPRQPAVGAPLYSVLDLGPTSDSLTVTGVNVRGQVTYYTEAGGIATAFRTEPNSPFNLDTDALGTLGGFSAQAMGINAANQVVGTSERFGGGYHAFRTTAGSPIDPATDDLGTLGGPSSVAVAVNDRGQAVGYSETAVAGIVRAFRTSAGASINPAADGLGTLGGGSSKAIAINNRGQVIGESRVADAGPVRGFRTAVDAAIDPLSSDLGSLGGAATFARGINRSGQVVGFSNLGGAGGEGPLRAFRTQPDAAIDPETDDLGTLGGARSFARAINDRSEVVGESEWSGSSAMRAFVAGPDGVMLDLNTLLEPSAEGWELLSARGVNNRGQILAVGQWDPDGAGPEPAASRAALLTPARQIRVTEWKSAAGGSWSGSGWDAGVPDATGHHARFSGTPASTAAVALDGQRVVGRLDFASGGSAAGGYSLDGPGSLTLRNGLEAVSLWRRWRSADRGPAGRSRR
jgi:probable HAF family extracellular repeat protein